MKSKRTTEEIVVKWTQVEVVEEGNGGFSRYYRVDIDENMPRLKHYCRPIPRNKLPKHLQETMILLDLTPTIEGVGAKWTYSYTGLYVYNIYRRKPRRLKTP